LETGLNFIEFNYMLLQAYDFWHLFREYDCRIQMGGNDQWGNILAGSDLTRRLEGEVIHGLTFPLLTTSSGTKMGKTNKGAVWLDEEMTSPYEYYQYWINQDDRDVRRFLALFTFLPLDEIRRLCDQAESDIRIAKEVLAYEATRICHGKEEADKAREASRQLFGTDPSVASESIPTHHIPLEELRCGIPAYVLFHHVGLCKSRGEARRLISQGGGYLNGQQVEVHDRMTGLEDLEDRTLLLRAGKKRYMKVVVD
jgi:tyrosyl-tRNA synthetase